VLGTKSFGKGSVQTIIPLSGRGAMRLTTSRYYTPSGRSIQGTGIEPDIEVPQAKLEVVEGRKRRTEASLRNALKNDNGKNGVKDKKKPKKNGATDKDTPQDYQLSRALDLLRGLALFAGVTAK